MPGEAFGYKIMYGTLDLIPEGTVVQMSQKENMVEKLGKQTPDQRKAVHSTVLAAFRAPSKPQKKAA